MLKQLLWTGLVVFLLLMSSTALGQLPPGFHLETVVSDASFPATLLPLPDGRLFYAELSTGHVRVVVNDTLLPEPFVTLFEPIVPEIDRNRGLKTLGLAIDQDFMVNGFVYVTYTPLLTDIVVSRFTAIGNVGIDEFEIIRMPTTPGQLHHGGRLRFAPDGSLFITRGDSRMEDLAQDPVFDQGKILRINPDGSIPDDNPFPDSPVFALGIRNSFGIAIHPVTGDPFISDNGPQSGDEVNRLISGGNYGWPICIGACDPPDPRFIDPLISITPTIGPTGMDFYTGDTFPVQYRNDLFFADTGTGLIQRLKLMPPDFDRKGIHETFAKGFGTGILDVKVGVDGKLYFSTRNTIYRIVPPDPASTAGLQGIVTTLTAEGEPLVVVGAEVVLKRKTKDGKTLFKQKTLTDEAGAYEFAGLPKGKYIMVVKRQGFEKGKVERFKLTAGEVLIGETDVLLISG